ncbi:tetratricopeptide repeat protein [Parafilimonas sp.]|uniref:tetratricopeptide repeat protein n=1 Tax=Parafilimonas sp. TaxID=1969739 RepID=UPI0039E44FFC
MKMLIAAIAACLFEGYVLLNHVNKSTNTIDADAARQSVLQYKQKFAVGCAANAAAFNPDDSFNIIPLLNGWGNYRMPVTATNDSARIYFEQGINMYYGFHIIEALASFDKSTKFDSGFAMGYWGKALSYGPNINDYGYAASPEALTAVAKAKALSGNCSPVEKGLINAMTVRYAADTTQTREHLNQLYADAMQKVHAQFPESLDAVVLYADALMVQHPWDLYDRYGKPKAWTPLIVATLEEALKKNFRHPGAAHYYIHAVEASDHPERALAVSDELPNLMPGVSHVVHMPAHIYIRTGNYAKGFGLNDKAVKGYEDYLRIYPAVVNNASLYLVHNLHMQATCANMEGNYADAMRISIDARNSFDSSWLSLPDFMGIFVQYIYMTPVLTQIRFGKWDDILQNAEIPSGYVYASLLRHYARGLAFARKHDFVHAGNELAVLQTGLKHDQLKAPAPNYANPGVNGARVAENILQGVIAEEQNNLQRSITYLQQAVELEDAMIYNEPKDWVHPARQYLGTVLIKAGRYAEAEKVFKEDEAINPNNGWSYTGLVIALKKQQKNKAAENVQQLLKKTFNRSDTKVTAAVF